MEGRRLFWQIFAACVAISAAMLCALGLYLAWEAHAAHLDDKAQELLTGARGCQRRIADPLRRSAIDEVEAVSADVREATLMRVTVILPDGRVVGDTSEDPAAMGSHSDRPEVIEALGGETGRSRRYSTTLHTECLYVAVPVVDDGRIRAVVRTSMPVATLMQTVHSMSLRILLGAVAATLVSAAVSRWVARRIARPLEALRDGAERFARGQFDPPLPVAGAEEVRALAGSLNAMAGEMNRRIETAQTQENELEAVLASMQEGVLALDLAGRILKVNAAAAAILEVDPRRVRGRLVAEVIRKASLLQFVERSMAAQESIFEEFELRADESLWLAVYGAPLFDAQRRRIGALVVLHDVTRLRRLEQVRRDFVANVSHELRTPITSIRGFLETVLHENFADPDNAARFVGIALKQAARLEAILEDLLQLSRIERGAEKRSISLTLEPIGEILQSAAEMIGSQAEARQIRIEVDCPESLVASVNAVLLEQAVANLIANALAYSPEGATVRVKAALGEGDVVLRVEDDGCGIEAAHLPRLFERFYRVDRARSRRLGGTGLGLAIVKHVALAHGGSVRVESHPGRGSTFFIHLPAPTSD